MRFLKRLYEQVFYSEYGAITMSVAVLAAVFGVAFFAESDLTKFLYKQNLLSLPYVFEFGSIVVALLIVNICRRAIKTTNRLRMIMYALFFAIGGGLSFITFTYTNWLSLDLSYSALLLLASIGRLSIALGILIGAMIPIENKIKGFNEFVTRVAVYTVWILVIFFMLKLRNVDFLTKPLNEQWFSTIEYLISIILIVAFAFHYRGYHLKKNRYLMMFMNGLAILLMAQMIRLIFVEYRFLYHFVYSAYIFIGYIYLYNAIYGYNILSPIQHLINEEKQIKLYAENLEVIVDRRTTEMKNNNMRLIQEIDYAKSIQQSLLPARKVNFNKVVFVSEYFPCERLSGDFFDIYRLDEDNIGMYVLDVSGHGVSAALMTMFCNNYIKSSEKLIMKYRGLKPHRNLKHFYEEFNKMKFPDEMYMVMFFACYNLESNILTYSSGGMNCSPMVMKRDGTLLYLDNSQGFPICKMSSFFTPTYTSEEIQLDKGDRVIFYTDGLVDNVKNSTISQEVLEEVLFDYKNRSLKSLNNKIKSYINVESGESEDDITYFIMEI
jgi:sigma-B regulation protein RsbU (phosphoserine phosphatase)